VALNLCGNWLVYEPMKAMNKSETGKDLSVDKISIVLKVLSILSLCDSPFCYDGNEFSIKGTNTHNSPKYQVLVVSRKEIYFLWSLKISGYCSGQNGNCAQTLANSEYDTIEHYHSGP
jgi:hypothetical protein